MASNKNQHFVPRCYLRPFSADPDQKTIHLYNLDRAAPILNAPIKSQCSRDYFYGTDPFLERAIQGVEASYASELPHLLDYGKPLTSKSRVVVPRFWFLQHTRTVAASERAVSMSEDADELIRHPDESFKIGIKQAVQHALSTYADNLEALDDLKIVLLRNRTRTPFITSDDPAVIVNRWLQNNKLVMGPGYGIASAGLICFLPLSPDVCCILYDGAIYSIPNSDNWADLRSIEDVNSINEMQYLNCMANLYFHDSRVAGMFKELHRDNFGARPPSRHQIHYAIKSETSRDGSTKYIVVDKSALPDHTSGLIHMEVIRIIPSSWPRFLKWRAGGSYFSNDSGAGHLRRAHAHSRPGIRPYTKRRTRH